MRTMKFTTQAIDTEGCSKDELSARISGCRKQIRDWMILNQIASEKGLRFHFSHDSNAPSGHGSFVVRTP